MQFKRINNGHTTAAPAAYHSTERPQKHMDCGLSIEKHIRINSHRCTHTAHWVNANRITFYSHWKRVRAQERVWDRRRVEKMYSRIDNKCKVSDDLRIDERTPNGAWERCTDCDVHWRSDELYPKNEFLSRASASLTVALTHNRHTSLTELTIFQFHSLDMRIPYGIDMYVVYICTSSDRGEEWDSFRVDWLGGVEPVQVCWFKSFFWSIDQESSVGQHPKGI